MWFYGINILAALVMAGFVFLTDLVWYSKPFFAPTWSRVSEKQPLPQEKKPKIDLLCAKFIFHFSAALAVTYFIGDSTHYGQAMLIALVLGIAVAASALGVHYQKLEFVYTQYLIDAGFEVFRFLLMGLTLCFWNNTFAN